MADETRYVCLTLDFDAMSLQLGSLGTTNMGILSRGEMGPVGAERLLKVAKKHDVPLTFAVPGFTAYCYPDLIKRIDAEGHEIVHHGWVHENPCKFSREDEKANLERGFRAIEFATGKRPQGYRSPAWDLSENSIDLLFEMGLEYDSSCMGCDFYPYYLRKGDKPSFTEPYIFGELCDLVELPVSWALDDFPPFEYYLGVNTGLMSPVTVREYWQRDFDYVVAECPGGIFNLTCHPQVIGRGGRLTMYEEFIQYMKGVPNVRFVTLGEYAKAWKAANPLDEWAKKNPYKAGKGAYKGKA